MNDYAYCNVNELKTWLYLKETRHKGYIVCDEIYMYLSHKNRNIGVNQNEVMGPGLVIGPRNES